MVGGKAWIWLVVIAGLAIGGVVVAGWSSKAAPNAGEKDGGDAGRVGPQRPLATKPVARPAPGLSVLSTYSNAEYRASFKYPRNYPLDEGPLDQETVENIAGLRSQEELESEQPGGVLAATIIVPDDAFPNTTFAGGSAQFAVHRYLASEGCQELPAKRLGDAWRATGDRDDSGCGVCMGGHRCW